MSRMKHITIDEAELLETKFEQLEKRVENIERCIFSQDGSFTHGNQNNQGMQQVLQLLTTMVDRQMHHQNPNPNQNPNQVNFNNQQTDQTLNKQNHDATNNNNNKGSTPLDMGRFRTIF